MRMSEAEFLNRLNKAFPEKVIFAEQARLSVYLSLFVEIRRYARGTAYHLFNGLPAEALFGKKQGISNPICTVEINADSLPILPPLNWPTMCFEPIH